MRTLLSFMKKEVTAQLRTGKMLALFAVFAVFGIMNPLIAKLTPVIFELLEDAIAESGMVIGISEVSALDSWAQFYKNIPMVLILFIVLESNIFTKEYSSGTLVLSLTKGFARYKVVVTKAMSLVLLWSISYWLCFGITYGLTAVFWEQSNVLHLGFAAFCWWLFGMLIVALMVLLSTVFSSMTGVMLVTGGIAFGMYLFSLLPKIGKFSPAYLGNGTSLAYGLLEADTFTAAIVITAVITLGAFIASVPFFNKKQL